MGAPLTERQQRILALFKVAIDREREAQQLYTEMLATCDDPESRQLIESQRATEQMHEEVLLDR